MTLTIRARGIDAPMKVKFRIHPPTEGEQLQG